MRVFIKSIKYIWIILVAILISQDAPAGGLNVPEGGGQVCIVTESKDDVSVQGSLRRALEMGYNVTDSSLPSFCKEKIVFRTEDTISLKHPIVLDNQAAPGFTLEKDPSVTGQVILDGSGLKEGDCGIVLASTNVTIRGLTIRNAPRAGICIRSGSNQNVIENVVVTNSQDGILVEGGAQSNLIKNNFLYDNTGYGVNLEDATQNEVTRNGLYRNGVGAVASPAINIKPTIDTTFSANGTNTLWSIYGSVPNSVARVEIYRGLVEDSSTNSNTNPATNFVDDIADIIANVFNIDIPGQASEEVFALAIAADGSTSPSSTVVTLNTEGGGSGQGGNCTFEPGDQKSCRPPTNYSPFFDFDCDGIPDIIEDENKNCIADPGETDSENPDSDGDLLPDGVEDKNKNGVYEEGDETDPLNDDTDGDKIQDGTEDRSKDGNHQQNELDPRKKDTDDDGIDDDKEDTNKDGIFQPPTPDGVGETDGTDDDTDDDGLIDGYDEDIFPDGVHDPFRESNPRLKDTDDDGLFDGVDDCPNIKTLSCKTPCTPGNVPDELLDNDNDTIPDIAEDLNHNCTKDVGETSPYEKDTDHDGKNDNKDPCPDNNDLTCEGECDPENINPFLDSDGDGKKNSEEDVNGNCIVDAGESDPFNPHSDTDGIPDGADTCPLDPNPLCENNCAVGVPPPPEQDSDGDAIPDANEDINENCIKDVNETDFRQRDTDNDTQNDNSDPCPLNPDAACVKECIEGDFIPPQRDSDKDGLKDVLEDDNKNCISDVGETDAYNADSDVDGLKDGTEDKNQDGVFDAEETNPSNPDTDGDGILDGGEDKNLNGIKDFEECDPRSPDTDNDGIFDYNEDINKNGIWDAGETHCARDDTDRDNLLDGAEDLNKNSFVDAGETDPRNPDTDGDGATDGQEINQGTNPIDANASDLRRALGQGCAFMGGGSFANGGIFGLWMGLIGIGWMIRKKKLK